MKVISHYDDEIGKWIFVQVPIAWSCNNEANGDGRCCPRWCGNESICTASFDTDDCPKGNS
jgi:hypothetical protein